MDEKVTDNQGGKIITFYSYKGGTGRSMVLANVAWILASTGKKVLVLDWDLEAPGVFRYFRPFLPEAHRDLKTSEGIIDFIVRYKLDFKALPSKDVKKIEEEWYKERANISEYAIPLNFDFPLDGKLDFVPAGAQGAEYVKVFSSFNWEEFYEKSKGGPFLEAVKKSMREKYDYILIDSRTGISDTASICTIQMPDMLVVCFTFNNQNIDGASDVARSIHNKRESYVKDCKWLYPFDLFPVPTRVSQAELDKLKLRREYAWRKFDRFPLQIPKLHEDDYRLKVEIPESAFFSYEEVLSVFREERKDPKTVLSAIISLTEYLTNAKFIQFEKPENAQRYLQEYAQTSDVDHNGSLIPNALKSLSSNPARIAEELLEKLSAEGQAESKKLWTRLILKDESGNYKRLTIRKSDLGVSDSIIDHYANAGLLAVTKDSIYGEETIAVVKNELPDSWNRIEEWIINDQKFLKWRHQIAVDLLDWERNNKAEDFLLYGAKLHTAKVWLISRVGDLNDRERNYIGISDKQANTNWRKRFFRLFSLVLIVFILSVIIYYLSQRSSRENNEKNAVSNLLEARKELQGKNYDNAINYLNKAISLKPDSPDAYLSRGESYFYKGDFIKAIEDFDEYLKYKPDDARAYFFSGQAHYEKGDLHKAIEDFDNAIKWKSDHAEAFNSRATAYRKMGRTQEALDDYGQAIRFNKDYAKAYYNLGDLHNEIGSYSSAINDFNIAIERQADYPEAYNGRGLARMKLGNPDYAQKDFEKAIEDDPDYAEAFYNWGLLRLERYKDKKNALHYFDRAIALDGNKARYYLGRAQTHDDNFPKEALNDYKQALKLLKESAGNPDQASKVQGDYADLYMKRAAYYEKLKDLKAALADYRESQKHIPSDRTDLLERVQAKIPQLEKMGEGTPIESSSNKGSLILSFKNRNGTLVPENQIRELKMLITLIPDRKSRPARKSISFAASSYNGIPTGGYWLDVRVNRRRIQRRYIVIREGENKMEGLSIN